MFHWFLLVLLRFSNDFEWNHMFCFGLSMFSDEYMCFAVVFLWFSMKWRVLYMFSMLFWYLLKFAHELILSRLMWSESPYSNQWNLLWFLIIKMPFEFEPTFLFISYCVWKKEVMMKTNTGILMDPSVIAMIFLMR